MKESKPELERKDVVIFDQDKLKSPAAKDDSMDSWYSFFRSVLSLRQDRRNFFEIELTRVSRTIDLVRMELVKAVYAIFELIKEGRSDRAIDRLLYPKIKPDTPGHFGIFRRVFHADEVCSGKKVISDFADTYADAVAPPSGGCATHFFQARKDILNALSLRPDDLGGRNYQNPYFPEGNFVIDMAILTRLLQQRLYHGPLFMSTPPMINPVLVAGSDVKNDLASDPNTPLIDTGERLIFEVRDLVFSVLKGLFQPNCTTTEAFDRIFAQSSLEDGVRKAFIGEQLVTIEKGQNSERIITLPGFSARTDECSIVSAPASGSAG